MAKRSSKPRDLNALAASIVRQATDETPDPPVEQSPPPDPVETGRQGGLKGGRARAEKLTPKQRSEVARRAAQARWKKS